MTADLAYVTEPADPLAGSIKLRSEDFVVEEQPLYEPAGKGQHLYVFVEKREQTTTDTTRQLARVFRTRRADVGFAGMKDKHAVTRQLFSVPVGDESTLAKRMNRLKYTSLKLLWTDRHTFPVRRGHLRGNRFEIRIRNLDPSHVTRIHQTLTKLASTGMPNYFGDQRFGYRQANHELGRRLLQGRWQDFVDLLLGQPSDEDYAATRTGRQAYERGDMVAALNAWPRHLRHDRQALDALRQGRTPREAVMTIDRQQRTFLASSFQSAMFNAVLDRRIRDGRFGALLDGDVAWDHANRTTFPVDHATAEAENTPDSRFAAQEISATGPMWGPTMLRASSDVARWEQDVLNAFGVLPDDLRGGAQGRADGSRRPLRCPLADPKARAGSDEHGPYIEVAFGLPRGSFATIVLRELLHAQPLQQSAEL